MIFPLCTAAVSDITLDVGDEFYVYGSETAEVAKILNISESELEKYRIDNTIAYIAVNADNSKQIRITESETDFSIGVINITGLTDNKINELIPDITGFDGARGEIVSLNGQKFIKTELVSSDSGGDYMLTEYITVADRICYTISFYTSASADTDYVDKLFESCRCSAFISASPTVGNAVYYIVSAALLLFAVCAVAITVWILRDIKKEKSGMGESDASE